MTNWLSYHIFYSGNLDRCLIEGVRPLVNRLRSANAIEQWFFIRYWNGGPHIRLRLSPACSAQALNGLVLDHWRAFLADYSAKEAAGKEYAVQLERMRTFQSSRVATGDLLPELAEEYEPVQPANEVQVRPYTYDAARYGCGPAREITEAHFCLSSDIALAIVSASRENRRARRSFALYLVAIACRVLDLPLPITAKLLGMPAHLLHALRPELKNDFVHQLGFTVFEDQKEEVLGMFQMLNAPGEPLGSASTHRLMEGWRQDLEHCFGEIRRIRDARLTDAEPEALLLEYLHLMCNRLGIGYAEECYLYYLCSSALSHQEVCCSL
jgi:thiopeptide-type bacteriocin biosynthesis protein